MALACQPAAGLQRAPLCACALRVGNALAQALVRAPECIVALPAERGPRAFRINLPGGETGSCAGEQLPELVKVDERLQILGQVLEADAASAHGGIPRPREQ